MTTPSTPDSVTVKTAVPAARRLYRRKQKNHPSLRFQSFRQSGR